jgi:hypothetical protein
MGAKMFLINIFFIATSAVFFNGCSDDSRVGDPNAKKPEEESPSPKFAWYEEQKKVCAGFNDEQSCINSGKGCIFNKETKFCTAAPLGVCGNDSELYPESWGGDSLINAESYTEDR